MSVLQRIGEIESEMARTQKNKATNAHLGLLKAKLAKLRAGLLDTGAKASGGGGGGGGFEVKATGDARVGFIGFPSVGKSSLLNKLTGQSSEVADYAFTTLTCIPGVVNHKGTKIQCLDLPGIIEGAKDGKGRGKQVISTGMTCSLLLIILDAMKPLTDKRKIEHELHGFGMRLNKQPPNISFSRRSAGGIQVTKSGCVEMTNLDDETVTGILKEYNINSAQVVFREDSTADDLIDVIEGNRKYVPAIYVMNKIDQLTIEELDIMSQVPHYCMISAEHGWGLDTLLNMMWDYMNLIRIYTKPKSQIPDYTAPVVVSRGPPQPTVGDFCNKIHRSMLADLKFAMVWGKSVKHQPQRCGKEHPLEDEDIVQIVKKTAA